MRLLSSPLLAASSLVLLSCLGASCAAPVGESEGSTQDDLKSCAIGTTVKGIDVSYYQATVDWAAVKASGRVFAFARVSDGTKHRDPKFATNWSGMASAGVIRGAYQYFRPSQSAAAQADLFLSAMGTLGEGDLPPALDVETAEGLSSATVRAGIKAWIARVEAATGRHAIVYTAAFMTPTIGNDFVAQPLWVANFGATCPTMPSSWTSWKFFQSSGSGAATGVTGKVDLDVFNGSLATLQAFVASSRIGGAAPSTDPPAPPADDTNPGDPNAPDTNPADPSADPNTPPPAGTPADGGCYSTTLGQNEAALSCVESKYDGGGWFQCHDGLWYRGATATSGPYGTCSSSHPL